MIAKSSDNVTLVAGVTNKNGTCNDYMYHMAVGKMFGDFGKSSVN